MSMDTILLAVGNTEGEQRDRLERTTVDIAGPTGADVVLVHVFSDEEYQTARENLDIDDFSEVTPDDIADRLESVRRLRDGLESAGVEVTTHGRTGNGDSAGERVVEFADEVGADLVVVGGRKRSPAGKAVFGSTAQDILLNASCPVTFVRGE